ncbi:MAG: DUF3089 domain-containing protein, partial [Bacteroidota bacterium]
YTFFPTLADAQSKDGILWTNIPYVRGRFWVRTKNWHRADMNLFYNNIRENAILRVSKFQEQATGRR